MKTHETLGYGRSQPFNAWPLMRMRAAVPALIALPQSMMAQGLIE